ncbi:hypothetical protein LZK75_37715 (plasmid) [Rhizobium leguminosarum]|nr:hypothetical protein LZK75_37715 [Rhizobium leguminosarum]
MTLENLEALVPCFASICAYLISVQTIPPDQWRDIGSRLLQLLDEPEIKESEYFRLSILSIFTRNPHINHFRSLASRYGSSDASAKREILLAGAVGGATDWLRELKEGFEGMDPWQQRAFIYCCALLPEDEKKYFLNRVTPPRPFEVVLSKWAKSARR